MDVTWTKHWWMTVLIMAVPTAALVWYVRAMIMGSRKIRENEEFKIKKKCKRVKRGKGK